MTGSAGLKVEKLAFEFEVFDRMQVKLQQVMLGFRFELGLSGFRMGLRCFCKFDAGFLP